MSSAARSLTAKEKKEKEKKDKKDKTEKFDPNVDREDISIVGDGESSSSGSHNNNGGHKSSHDDTSSDMQKFCNILQAGFDSVSKKIGDKLDDVGQKFGNSLNDLHASLDDRMTELIESSEMPNADCDFEAEVDSVSNSGSEVVRQRDHEMSDTSSTKGNTNKESFFKSKNKPKPKEKLGQKVDQDLADIVDREFSSPCSADEFKKFKEKFLRPENVEWLTSPEVPFNIYRRLNSDFKDVDKRLKFIQDQLCPVAISLTYAMDELGKGNLNEGMDILTETVQGFGYVFRSEITDKRRTLLKPKLPEDFKVLASDKCPPTPANLLGNISENSKKIAETEKLASQMDKVSNARSQASKNNNNNRDKPYSRNNNSNNSRGSYFKRGGFYNRRYDNQKKSYDNKDGQNSNKNYYNGDKNNSYFQKRNQRRK